MKIRLSLLSSRLKALFGCQGKINIEQDPEEPDFKRAWEEYCRSIRGKLRTVEAASLTDIAIVELLHVNYKSSQKLRTAIKSFNRSSTILSICMLILSTLMFILVLVQVWIQL